MRIRFPLLLGAIAVIAALVLSGPALAASAATRHQAEVPPLGLIALGQTGPYFEATIQAGASRGFEVNRVNSNDVAVKARTYVGVVSTIVNGGFGAADSTVQASGASTWVDYPTEVLTLAPSEKNMAAFTVSVPAGTAPGQYVSSIVLENAVAEAGTGTVALNRIVRQAVAVSIRVPGDLAPAFSLGHASLGATAGTSVVTVDTTNDGNQHLAPAGVMTLSDSAGTVISSNPITMGSFYAGMSTTVSVSLAGALPPGDYAMSLTLTDPLTGVSASLVDVALTVAAPGMLEQAAGFFAPVTALVPQGFGPLLIGLIMAGVLGLIAMGVLGARRLVRARARVARALVTALTPADRGW
jgi:hypothetical protein